MPRIGKVKAPYWPWDRLPEETFKNYQAFLHYRDMAPEERTITEAYRRYANKPDAATMHHGNFKMWAKTHRWIERATAYDGYIEERRQEAIVKEKQKLARQHVRQIEISARAALEENAALAHSNIKDVVDWDESGVRVKPSADLPSHVTAAISKVSLVHDRMGNANVTVEMHPKVRPIELEGQHFELWDSDKKQAEQAAANSYLELLAAMKAGKLDQLVEDMQPSLLHPPPGITITRKTMPTAEDIEKDKDNY